MLRRVRPDSITVHKDNTSLTRREQYEAMFEITYLVFIRYRGPFGISIPLPRLRTAHLSHPRHPFERFDLSEILLPEKGASHPDSH